MNAFAQLCKTFELLQAELQNAEGPVLRGLILLRMRQTLDAMWVEHGKSRTAPVEDLEAKEQVLKKLA